MFVIPLHPVGNIDRCSLQPPLAPKRQRPNEGLHGATAARSETPPIRICTYERSVLTNVNLSPQKFFNPLKRMVRSKGVKIQGVTETSHNETRGY